jgi:hypothetical protein
MPRSYTPPRPAYHTAPVTSRLPLAVLAGVLAASAALRVGIAALPLERDEGEYAYIGRAWHDGSVPYRDAFDQKPPGVLLAYRALFALGLDSVESIHWMGHAWLAAAVVPVMLLGWRLGGAAVGGGAALSAAVLAMDSSVLGNAANTELLALLPLSLGMYCASRRRGMGLALAAGLCGGFALCLKQVTLPIVLWPIGYLAVRPWPPGRQALRRGLAFAGGLAAVVGTAALYFVLLGAGREMWDAVVGHNLAYASSVPLSQYRYTLAAGGGPVAAAQWPWWLAALAGALVMRRVERRAAAPIAAWLAASALAVSAGGYFRPHYFMFLVPPVALLGVAGMAALARRLTAERHAAALTVAASLLAVAWTIGLHATYFRARSPELVSRQLYPHQPFAESVLAADWIRRSSAEDDTVFVYGSEPQILFHAGRRSASRYIILYPVYARAADAGARQAEVVAELERTRPRIVVVVLNTASLGPEPLLPRLLETRLREMLARDYAPAAATVVGPEGLARLLEPQGAGDPRLVAESADRPSLLLFRRR